MIFQPEQSYDCVQCGKSCRGWTVAIEPQAWASLESSGLALRVIQEHGIEAVVEDDEGLSLASVNGRCVMLDQNNLCRVHSTLGLKAKPRVCRTFPYYQVATPAGVRVAVSFCCTAVQQNRGRPLFKHAGELPEFADTPTLVIDQKRSLDWPAFERFHELLEENLDETGLPLSRAWGVLLRLGSGVSDRATLEAAFSLEPVQTAAATAYLKQAVNTYLALFESSDPEHAVQLRRAFNGGGSLDLKRWGLSLPAPELRQFQGQHRHLWQEGLRRYLRALLFRLVLGRRSSIAKGLMGLSLVEPLFDYYVAVSMLRAGRTALLHDDLALAYDEIERELMLHSRSTVDGFLDEWSAHYLAELNLE